MVRMGTAAATAALMAAWLVAGAARAGEPPPTGAAASRPGLPNGPMLTPGENAEETYQLNFVGIEHFVPRAFEYAAQVEPDNRLVFGDQNPHRAPPGW